MVNVLIPMAGAGSRFVKQGIKTPKQLLTVKGKHVLDISLESMKGLNERNLIFIVRDEQVYNFHIDEILKQKYGNNIKIIITDGLTERSVCSCLLAEEYIDNDSPLIINTLDIEFSPEFDVNEMMDNPSDGLILTFKSNSPNYSYASLDSLGNVIKTAEKKVISPNACVGVYGFKKGSDFVKYAKNMIEKNIRQNNEFYISPLYNLLIQDGLKIKTKPVQKIHIFGTPEEYEFYKNNVAINITDKPICLASDHSGFDAKEITKNLLDKHNIEYVDYGPVIGQDCDYKDYISQAARAINNKESDYGFGFCRTGQGVNMCANKYKGIRSSLIYNEYAMEMSIRHNCSNFFAIPGGKNFSPELMDNYIKIAKTETFDGGRFQVRIQELENESI